MCTTRARSIESLRIESRRATSAADITGLSCAAASRPRIAALSLHPANANDARRILNPVFIENVGLWLEASIWELAAGGRWLPYRALTSAAASLRYPISFTTAVSYTHLTLPTSDLV